MIVKHKNIFFLGLLLNLMLMTIFVLPVSGLAQALANPSFESGSGSNADNWSGNEHRECANLPTRTGDCSMAIHDNEFIYQTVSIDSDDAEYVEVYFTEGNVEILIKYDISNDDATGVCTWDGSGWDRCLFSSGFQVGDTIVSIEIVGHTDDTIVDDAALWYDDGQCSPC